jgi:two-component system chemotaxis sensor kinase CheA
MDDLLSDFLTETIEGLSILDQELVQLEKNPNDPDLLGSIFRIVHTIKGTCGFLGLPRLESVAHSGENLLGKFRDGEIEVTPEAVTLILQALDAIKMIVAAIGETEAEPEGDDAALIARLDAMVATATGDAPGTVDEMEAAFAAAEVQVDTPAEADVAAPAEPVADEAPAEAEADAPVEAAPEQDTAAEEAPKSASPPKPDADPKPAEAAEAGGPESTVAVKSIRVHVDLLEDLMNMVSELVLTRNQLLQILRTQDESDFAAPLQRLNYVTSELQEGVMQTRMQPIGNAWAKLPRIVRDLALELGKSIDLQMLGAETELDRQLLEMIKDPLTHMVRNSADHGIELPDDRAAAGKPETGRITLDARHEGGHIVIEISDDGKGLPLAKIKEKLIANGLATESDIESMTDQQIQQYIFKAGFSTAAAVTNVSGRGVGMDVVRTNIEKIGGTIELSSTEGKGSTFNIKIPLTLAIVNALIIESAGERFAIPQISVLELVRTSAKSDLQVEWINDAAVLRLRNQLLPLVSLRELLKFENANETEGDAEFIIVTQVGTYTFGIIVDRVFDTEEIVVKPVAPILREITMFSGNTILGDGSVVMILDPNGIAMATGEVAPTESAADRAAAAAQESGDKDRIALLLFKGDVDGPPMAVPLSLVARLEEIDCESIETSDGKPVVQYRGKLMPLVPIEASLPIKTEGRQPTLVFAEGERSMGLVVAEIIDIIEGRLDIELGSAKPGFIGTAVVAGAATEIVDAGHFLSNAFSDWSTAAQAPTDGKTRRVLLVDDSPFFRNLLSPLLQVAGYDVTTVESGDMALELREAGRDFDVILSDIEMPGMSGFEFAEAVKKESRWQDTPLVALSHGASANDLDRGRSVGFSDYVAKFDRDALLHTLSETLSQTRGAA